MPHAVGVALPPHLWTALASSALAFAAAPDFAAAAWASVPVVWLELRASSAAAPPHLSRSQTEHSSKHD